MLLCLSPPQACQALVAAGADLLRRNGKNRIPGSQLKVCVHTSHELCAAAGCVTCVDHLQRRQCAVCLCHTPGARCAAQLIAFRCCVFPPLALHIVKTHYSWLSPSTSTCRRRRRPSELPRTSSAGRFGTTKCAQHRLQARLASG